MVSSCRTSDHSRFVLRAAGTTGEAMAFQWLELEHFQVLMESTDVRELAEVIKMGPKPISWTDFNAIGPWGHPDNLEEG